MKLPTADVYQLKDIANIHGMVQLTKWLQPVQAEFRYLASEHRRITKDPSRKCYIVYSENKIALFVNDMTEGAFARLGEEE
ncbi:hypothetical protein HOO68_03375 [Candidatus Gracilibacteria bacterium]|nr:hypothetical protein [Candidatus Gracilibacteria bacterium]